MYNKIDKKMEIIAIEKKTLDAMEEKFGQFVSRMDDVCFRHNKKISPWLDNADVCRMLNISKRTLQTYRDNGLIPYSNIGGKFFYKEVDIQQILEEGLIKKRK